LLSFVIPEESAFRSTLYTLQGIRSKQPALKGRDFSRAIPAIEAKAAEAAEGMFMPLHPSLPLAFLLLASLAHAQQPADLSLDGPWQTGIGRQYTQTQTVPGLAQDSSKPSPGTLWYKRTVQLPAGDWTQATLTLNGARFAPTVYVDGEKVASSAGGMAPTVYALRSAAVAPGKSITLEVALESLNDLDPRDASAVPGADRWRTNDSSGLWDSVSLHFSGSARIARITPFTDFAHRSVSIHWQAEGAASPGQTVQAFLDDSGGKPVASSSPVALTALHGSIGITLPAAVQPWSPDHPNVYKLRLVLTAQNKPQDERDVSYGFKDFHTQDKRFYLNGQPIEMRGGTIVFQRFLRNPESAALAWNPDWFQQNIFLRLKSYGANAMRFHLGLPPEALLDLCDRDGLMVQMEWPFFHGIKASEASMVEQWTAWLDVAMRHPSVVIVHGWNETGGSELEAAWRSMNTVLAGYPKLVVAHRDTLHIHKYWWSLFENLGLYYDFADQFDRTIMVDEFGGNYLDQNGDPGGYPAVKETFLRFLGRDQTREGRLEFHAESNGRVGEYWRRIGAAGILPFCVLGGPQDGSSWFLGPLKDPQPMPVWDALAATFSPQAVSLDVWDRNYAPSQQVTIPLYFFNDADTAAKLIARVEIRSATATITSKLVSAEVPAHSHGQTPIALTLPATVGDWEFAATLENKVPGVTHPIVSFWKFRTLVPVVAPALQQAVIGVPADEAELRAFLARHGLKTTGLDDPKAAVLLASSQTWNHLSPALRQSLGAAVDRGQSVVMLDIGPRDLGQGYRKGDLGPLDGAPTINPADAYRKTQDLFSGIQVTFAQLPEPESHIQPGPDDASLWKNLPIPATWIWNGLRGGLIAPAADMEIAGLSPEGYLSQWAGHGADAGAIAAGSFYAYELAGYYAFSAKPKDQATMDALRKRVRFLAEDAPALQAVLNPDATIEQTDLNAGYKAASRGQARSLLPLSTSGKGLTRTDIAELTFGPGRGNVILSQVLTAGRLGNPSEPGLYGLRHDPAAEQLVLNMLAQALTHRDAAGDARAKP
jgi:beta-galactosidase